MIRFFKAGFPAQYITICLTGLVLWGRAFFDPPQMPEPQGFVPFYSSLFSLLATTPVIPVILGYLLVSFSAIALNRLLSSHDIVQKNSSLAGFVFIVLMSYHPQLLTLQPGNISVYILLLILIQLFISYNREEPYDLVYSAGFFTTIGSFFYFPLIFFFGFILFSFILIRAANWREWISSFLGFLTPFIFLAVYYFWYDMLPAKVIEYASAVRIEIDKTIFGNTFFILSTSAIVLFSLYCRINGFRRGKEKTIEIRRKTFLLNGILFFILGSFPFSSHLLLTHIEMMFIPFSALITIYLLQLKKYFWQETCFLLFLICILLNNLIFLFS